MSSVESIKGNLKQKFPKLLAFYRKLKLEYRRISILPELRRWDESARPDPADSSVKYQVVRDYGKKFGINTFVETGTYLGDLVANVRTSFQKVYSIELSDELWRRASERFRSDPEIRILRGDSSKILPKILSELSKPTLFWLDAHYSDGITARGELETPIELELRTIFAHQIKNHVILIDDARLFVKNPGYPTLTRVKELVDSNLPGHTFSLKDDIIRITPRAGTN